MKKNLIVTILLVGIMLASCKKDEVVSSDVAFMAMLSGAEEVPAVSTTASGMLDGVYNKDTKILTYTITYSGISPTAWHIHKGAKGTTGGVVFNFGSTFTSPFKSATVALTADQEADLMAGNYYVNIHSAKSASGEIRGQLMKQ
ncbi:CHRD domain containing protein [Emticicia oligotrophica DSM 17448]|uniref:CHRD domain containing protein n=1 Tax=Emticicia oligotrophica (strain DSM 17448 / CIP 109782 / MTCC 6937 / GPTSA100-15) TaxID=929562 RepID=A0ABN4AK12_EMTOG|nr:MULTISPECIES: CHRD domain-containing protein [Emticicia]AFK02481.1 CHRD domain containing protein [Emticicia oligotrophica DSM 17448]